MTEEFHDAEENLSDDKIARFDIKKKIKVKIADDKYIIKLTIKELIQESKIWLYNRQLISEKVEELKKEMRDNTIPSSSTPILMISVIYDEEIKSNDDYPKCLHIIDGQHRVQAIRELLDNSEINPEQEIFSECYFINNCETKNKDIATQLFKKRNSNMPFDNKDIPDTRIQDLVERIMDDEKLNPNVQGIRIKNEQNTSHEPFIHKKELFYIFNKHRQSFSNLSLDDIITNLKIITNKISIKDFKDIYKKTDDVDKKLKKYKKAKNADFWLGLKSSEKYSPEKWILYINNPQDFGK